MTMQRFQSTFEHAITLTFDGVTLVFAQEQVAAVEPLAGNAGERDEAALEFGGKHIAPLAMSLALERLACIPSGHRCALIVRVGHEHVAITGERVQRVPVERIRFEALPACMHAEDRLVDSIARVPAGVAFVPNLERLVDRIRSCEPV